MGYRDKQKDNRFDSEVVSRRRLLKAGGAAAFVTGLAGCMSDNGNGGSGQEVRDSRFDTFTNSEPPNSHFNPYNPAQGPGSISGLLQNWLWKHNRKTDEQWHPRISNKFSLEGTTATIGIDSSYKWADGMSVTATDLVKQLQIAKHLELPIWNYISGLQKKDKKTVEVKLKKSYNESVFRGFLNRRVFVKRGSDWEQWLDRFKDASGNQKKLEEVQNDLRTWTYARDSGNPVTNGPFVVERRSSNEWVLTPNKHFPYEFNIPKYVFNAVTADQQTWQMAISDHLDGARHFSVTTATVDKFPDHIEHYNLPIVKTSAPVVNFNHPPWGKREARQALEYLIDRKLLAENRNPRHTVLHQTTGFDDPIVKRFLTDRQRKQMSQYGIESKPKQAAERMRAAGLKKRDGTWRMADGSSVSLEWMGAQWPDSQGMAQTLEQLLPNFGIEFASTLVSTTQWGARRSKGQFDLTHAGIGVNEAEPTPWFYYSGVIQNRIFREQAGHPQKTVKLPPVGKPDGPLQTVDLQKLVQQMALTNDAEKLNKLAAQGAWYINQLLPVLPVTNGAITATVSMDDWTYPSVDADIMGMTNVFHQLLRETKGDSNRSVLQAKTK